MFDFPDAAERAPDKNFCFSLEGADSPYETYFPIACTTVPCLQPIRLAMVDFPNCRWQQWFGAMTES